ncbi:MAG: PH domain-containing protein, partial [Planctomycetes bacterium]|nr:PH domain-containing protein [Planctomycetota bacterium]
YTLTSEELRVREGLLERQERRIPLDRIQDLGFESTLLRRGLDQHDGEAERAAQERRLEAEVLDAIERDAALLAFEQPFPHSQLLAGQRVFERQVAGDGVAELQHEQAAGDDDEPELVDDEPQHQRQHHLAQRVDEPQQQDRRVQVTVREHRRRGGRRRFRRVAHHASARSGRAAPGRW